MGVEASSDVQPYVRSVRRSGAHTAAQTMLEDVLTIRAETGTGALSRRGAFARGVWRMFGAFGCSGVDWTCSCSVRVAVQTAKEAFGVRIMCFGPKAAHQGPRSLLLWHQ